ncbi:hypothetical protein HQ590_10330, partial [bacterium]|nr:hypothetical protein [bacterium]
MLPVLRRLGTTLVCTTVGLALFLPPTQAGERQGTTARIDVYVPESAFNLGQTKGSPGTRVASCNWLGKGKERTGVSCEKGLGKDWQEIWVEFVPEKGGEVDIDLQGEWYE